MGNLNRKCEVQNVFFFFFWPAPFKRAWLFQKNIALVSKWLTEKGLTKLCVVFEGMHEQLNMLNVYKS